MSLEKVSSNAHFGGELTKYKFKSKSLGGLETSFNVFVPKTAGSEKVPALFYLAGLTCTEDTGAQKGGFTATAAKNKIALIFPDTSPRGANIAGEDDSFDFGTGAGFYVKASEEKYKTHYNMYDLITIELPEKIRESSLPIDMDRVGVMGHSMGGHGALIIYLLALMRKDKHFKSASAFAPITNPSECQWGQKAFKGYLGSVEAGRGYDATLLLEKVPKGTSLNIIIDQGTDDQFLQQGQLLPENFEKSLQANGFEGQVTVEMQKGYDHSYWFISTFAQKHVEFHAKHLRA